MQKKWVVEVASVYHTSGYKIDAIGSALEERTRAEKYVQLCVEQGIDVRIRDIDGPVWKDA
jgi:hypothetical protein